MLEYPVHQAAGLRGLAPPAGPHLVAMVSHGDDQAELPLLWRLCTALVGLGYQVTVLDATTRESPANPGLAQHLDYRFRESADVVDAPGWTVLPSEMGVRSLCAETPHQLQSLQRLGHLFPDNEVLILYAKAEWLVPLLGDSSVTPVLAVSSMKHSLLTSYLALKRLLLNARLKPTILNMMDGPAGSTDHDPAAVTSHLSDCARQFLGYEVNALNIDLSADETRLGLAMRRLAAHMLETAMPLSGARFHGHHAMRAQDLNRFAGAR